MLKVLSAPTRLVQRLWQELARIFTVRYGVFFLLGVLLARAVLLGELYPLGIGFLVGVCLECPQQKGVAFWGVLCGLVLTITGLPLCGYFFSIGISYVLLSCYQKKELSWLMVPLLVGGVHLLSRGIISLWLDDKLYLWLALLFESFFVGIFAVVAWRGLEAYQKAKDGHVLIVEERTSLGLIVFGIVLGMNGLVWQDYSLQSMFSRYLVLWAAFWGGAGGGAALGVVVGLVPGVQGMVTMGSIAYYALAGLLGGVFRDFGKIGVVVGFALANFFLSFFFAEGGILIQALKETGVAVLLFLLFNIPVQRENLLAAACTDGRTPGILNLYYADKLKKIAQVFVDLGRVFHGGGVEKPEKDQLNFLFDQATSQVCADCSLQQVCWERNFYKTYRTIFNVCAKLETRGVIREEDFERDFRRRCLRLRELRVALNAQREVLKVVGIYEKQRETSQLLLNRQLLGLAKIMEGFSTEIKQKVVCNVNLESFLQKKLVEKGIAVEGLSVLQVPGVEKEIHITQQSCQQENLCTALVAPNISQALGQIFTLKNRDCAVKGEGEMCSYVLTPGKVFKVRVGEASCPKDESTVSGDFCASLPLPQQRFALLMCDGMGAGAAARAESSLAVDILSKLLLAGISPQTAVGTVNTALFLRSAQENFTTLDVTIINLVNGQCDFIKIGSSPSLVRTKGDLKAVQSSSPPIGILEEIKPQIFRHLLHHETNIIMMSDGVWDVLQNTVQTEFCLENLLGELDSFEPQIVAEYLLYMAKRVAGKQMPDDMCVLVASLEK